MCRQPASMLARDGKHILILMSGTGLGLFVLVEWERPQTPRRLIAHGSTGVENIAGVAGIALCRCAWVEGWTLQK